MDENVSKCKELFWLWYWGFFLPCHFVVSDSTMNVCYAVVKDFYVFYCPFCTFHFMYIKPERIKPWLQNFFYYYSDDFSVGLGSILSEGCLDNADADFCLNKWSLGEEKRIPYCVLNVKQTGSLAHRNSVRVWMVMFNLPADYSAKHRFSF